MVYKCCVALYEAYEANYTTSIAEGGGTFSTFIFPDVDDNPELQQRWIRFINSADWKPTKHSRICENHSEEKFLRHGKRLHLVSKELNPVPTIYPAAALAQPSILPTPPATSRKPPKLYR